MTDERAAYVLFGAAAICAFGWLKGWLTGENALDIDIDAQQRGSKGYEINQGYWAVLGGIFAFAGLWILLGGEI